MSDSIQQQIQRLKAKFLQLQKMQAQLRKENESQKQLISSLQTGTGLLQENVRVLQEQNHMLKAAASNMSEADKKAFEQTINKYIKEIDKCIALISE